jgi:hypothetical protein
MLVLVDWKENRKAEMTEEYQRQKEYASFGGYGIKYELF